LELKYILTHVGELLESNEFDANVADKLRQMMAPAEEYFEKEGRIVDAAREAKDKFEMEDMDGFQESAIYQDAIGRELFRGSQFSIALFLRIYAHENYARFQQALVNQFSDRVAEHWKVSNDYKKNAIRIWQSITDYESMDWEIEWRDGALRMLNYVSQGLFMLTLLAVLVFLLMFQWPHLQQQTLECLPFTGAALVLSGSYAAIYAFIQQESRENFDNLRDLMKGVIECDVTEIIDAYRHFKATPDIEISHIREELRSFQKVTINYIYD